MTGAIYNAPARAPVGCGSRRPSSLKSLAGRSRSVSSRKSNCARDSRRRALPAAAVNIVVSIQASFAAGAFDIVTGDVERLGGRPPKPLRDVLAEALKSLSAEDLQPSRLFHQETTHWRIAMSDTKKLIAVVGATGHQGGAVVRALQASGQFKVRALTRIPPSIRSWLMKSCWRI